MNQPTWCMKTYLLPSRFTNSVWLFVGRVEPLEAQSLAFLINGCSERREGMCATTWRVRTVRIKDQFKRIIIEEGLEGSKVRSVGPANGEGCRKEVQASTIKGSYHSISKSGSSSAWSKLGVERWQLRSPDVKGNQATGKKKIGKSPEIQQKCGGIYGSSIWEFLRVISATEYGSSGLIASTFYQDKTRPDEPVPDALDRSFKVHRAVDQKNTRGDTYLLRVWSCLSLFR